MDELPKRVLYAFYEDRILQYEQIVAMSGTSLPYVRNTINKFFIPEGYVEEITVPRPGKKHDYFRLTDRGRIAVKQIHVRREWMSTRMNELVTSGMTLAEAAVKVATECVELTELT